MTSESQLLGRKIHLHDLTPDVRSMRTSPTNYLRSCLLFRRYATPSLKCACMLLESWLPCQVMDACIANLKHEQTARMQQALAKDPARRPSAAALLGHPWLAGRHPLPWSAHRPAPAPLPAGRPTAAAALAPDTPPRCNPAGAPQQAP